MIVLAMCGHAEAGDTPPGGKDNPAAKPADKPPKDDGGDKPTPKVATSAQRCKVPVPGEQTSSPKPKPKPCQVSEFGLDRSTQLICIDAAGGCLAGIEIDGKPAQPTALSPNRSIAVVVHSTGDDKVVLAMDGAIGESTPVTFTVTPTAGLDLKSAALARSIDAPTSPTDCYYVSYFPPRKPGTVTLSMVVTTPNDAARAGCKKEHTAVEPKAGETPQAYGVLEPERVEPMAAILPARPEPPPARTPAQPGAAVSCQWSICNITNPTAAPPADPHPNAAGKGQANTAPTSETYVYEFFVPTPYGGALRLGLGGLWVPALGHSYSAKTAGMSNLAQIIDGDASPFTMELVVGYAPFVFDRSSRFDGRVYGPESSGRLAMYFGLGALSSSGGSKVEWLRSIYWGFEYELTPGSSVAVTAVARRVDGLANDLKVGSVVPVGTTVTNTTFAFGGAIVFNFTPAFFKFASSVLP